MSCYLATPGAKRPLVAEVPEHLVRAFAIANGLGLPHPTQTAVSWLENQAEYDNTPSYWSPYGYVGEMRSGASVYLLPWARGAFGMLLTSLPALKRPDLGNIDPLVWYQGLSARAMEYGATGRLLGAFQLAEEQMDPLGPEGDWVVNHISHVRQAQTSGLLLTDPVKIRRRVKAYSQRAPL